MPENLWLSS